MTLKKKILLTGSTGFVGKQLLQRLVASGHHVYALIRNKYGKTPAERAVQLLDGSPTGTDGLDRITVLSGDLSAPQAGLTDADVNQLRGEVDLVIHSAALVQFDHELADELQETNVEGTRRMLALAEEIRAPRFYMISTAYTAGGNLDAADALHPLDGPFHNPYEQTKCRAEHLVAAAGHNGLETAIFRPSVIIGDSRTGLADTSLTIYGFIRGVRLFAKKLRGNFQGPYRFAADGACTQNVVPVDYVCEAITAAVDSEVSSGIHHLTNPQPPTNEEIFGIILKHLNLPRDLFQLEPHLAPEGMTAEERMLDQLISTYRVYFLNDWKFANTRLPALTHGQIDDIIGTYCRTL